MASATRSSSPPAAAGDNASEPSSPQLSPRSKLKAMLAAVDDDSDDEGGNEVSGPIDMQALFKSIDKSKVSSEETSRPTQNDEDEDSDSEDDEEISRPRGRLARRMLGTTTTKEPPKEASKTPDDASNHTAKPARRDTEPVAVANGEDKQTTENEDDEDEDDITTLPHRRAIRPARPSTPEAAADADLPPSPGLFVTPAGSTVSRGPGAGSDSEEEFPADLAKSDRFKALVARKRQERLVREAEEARKQKERAERMASATVPADEDDDVSDISDDEGGRKLTQRDSRPARKASKKALEEMNRETQRISRSLQLAHEAKTKKKITKASLFERFNFKPAGATTEGKPASSSRPSTPNSAQQTDAEAGESGTPPSSPPLAGASKPTAEASAVPADVVEEEEEDELLDIAAALAQSKKTQDKGKGKAVATIAEASPKKPAIAKPKRQVRVKLPPPQTNLVTIESDEELEITNTKKSKLDAVFDRLPTKKEQTARSIEALRRLANLSSPPREPTRGRRGKPSMTGAELHMSLQQRARAQAKLERERRLEHLRSKGINVQTEEEREREREEVEDMVARARKEVEEIMEREREEAKQARKEKRKNGEDDPLGWDDSDDDSFQDSGEEEPAEIELSGSEEEDEDGAEDDEMAEDADGDEEAPAANPMFDNEADDDGDSEEKGAQAASDEEDELPTAARPRRSKKHTQIVSDDEDDVDERIQATPKPKSAQPKSPSGPHSSPKIPTSVLRSATKSFIPGLPVAAAAPAGLGLTQIFAGTMDDSQARPSNGSPQEFMPSLDNFPDSQFSATAGQSQADDKVPDSQPTQGTTSDGRETQTQGVQLHYTQSQGHGFDSLMEMDNTQMSELIDPTQDAGYQDFTPIKQRFVEPPHSTMSTVMLPSEPPEETIQDSPLVKRKGKLRRRGEASLSISSLPPTAAPESPSAGPSAATAGRDVAPSNQEESSAKSAFRMMEKAAKRKKRVQEKLKKRMGDAKEWLEQEAEESEDEYAGLGGADGEDSSEDDEELAKEMIDDAAGNDADAAKMAGFYADRERAADAAQVDKLFRDLTTGNLRKRRRGGGGGDGNDFDLSDSDDGGEARRRMKRRQFAKMQRALLADERIGKIAENPRNAAFLKSIEDRNSDDEWDFGENFAADSGGDSESQSQDQGAGHHGEESIPNSQPTTAANTNMGRKRSRMVDHHPSRPAPHARRMENAARPSTLTEVRRSLSTLLDEPNASIASIIPATEIGSDSEGEEGEGDERRSSSTNKENTTTATTTRTVEVVDRIALKRSASSNSSSSSNSNHLAFAATGAGGGNGGFKVPALLRKATTNSLISNSSASSSGSGNGGASASQISKSGGGMGMGMGAGKMTGGEDAVKLKRTAGRGSGINYFARENERRAAVADAERRREKKKWRGVEGQKKAVSGLFGAGRFE